MKRVAVLLSLTLSLVVAHADLVLQQNIQSGMINGTVTTRIKGNKIRMDMPSTPQGSMSTIVDLNSGDSITLLHQQKIAMKMPGAEIKQMAESMKKARANAGTNAPPAFHDTGKTEKVGNFDAEVYTWSDPEGAKQTVWVAKNYPNSAKIKVQMDKLNHSPVGELSKGLSPDISALPGVVVRTQTEMSGQNVTSTLISAKEETVAPSVFEVPGDYQQMTQPGAGAAPSH